MKTVSLVLFLLLLVVPVLSNGDGRVMKDGTVYSVVQDKKRDTGITIESGLWFTGGQLARIIDKGEHIPLDTQRKSARWSTFLMHIEYDKVSTKEAFLDGKVVRSVPKVMVERAVEFNPFFITAFIYVICMVFVCRFHDKKSIICAVAAALAATFATIAATMVAMVAFVAASTALFTATTVAILVGNKKLVIKLVIIGIVAMVTSSVSMFFFV